MVRSGRPLPSKRGSAPSRQQKTTRKVQERRVRKGQRDDDGAVLVLCVVVVFFLATILVPVWLSGSVDVGFYHNLEFDTFSNRN